MREVDVASLLEAGRDGPAWRTVWSEATGEFVAVRPDGGDDPGPVRLLGVVTDRAALEAALRCWWRLVGRPGPPAGLERAAAGLADERFG